MNIAYFWHDLPDQNPLIHLVSSICNGNVGIERYAWRIGIVQNLFAYCLFFFGEFFCPNYTSLVMITKLLPLSLNFKRILSLWKNFTVFIWELISNLIFLFSPLKFLWWTLITLPLKFRLFLFEFCLIRLNSLGCQSSRPAAIDVFEKIETPEGFFFMLCLMQETKNVITVLIIYWKR